MKYEKLKKALAIIAVVLFTLFIIFGIVFSILSDKNNSVASADEGQPATFEEYSTYYYINEGTTIGTLTQTKTYEKIKGTAFPTIVELYITGQNAIRITTLMCPDSLENEIIMIYEDGNVYHISENSLIFGLAVTDRDYITQDRSLWDNWLLALGIIDPLNNLKEYTINSTGGSGGDYDEGYQAGYDQGYHDGDESGYQSGYDDGVQIMQDELDNLQAEYDKLRERYESLLDSSTDYVDDLEELRDLIEQKEKEIANLQAQLNSSYQDGYNNGYNKGYSEGLNLVQSNSIINPITFLLTPVHDFLNIRLFGVFSLGTSLNVVLFVGIALIFIKMFAGG